MGSGGGFGNGDAAALAKPAELSGSRFLQARARPSVRVCVLIVYFVVLLLCTSTIYLAQPFWICLIYICLEIVWSLCVLPSLCTSAFSLLSASALPSR